MVLLLVWLRVVIDLLVLPCGWGACNFAFGLVCFYVMLFGVFGLYLIVFTP